MADFDAGEIQLIKELGFDPRFASICRKILDAHGGIPKYNGKETKTSDQKHDDWVYRSGIDDGIELVLKSLAYDY